MSLKSDQSDATSRPTSRSTRASITPDDPSSFTCSICMDLLYKPCVNTCGHSFCFWCMHRAMDVLKTHHACPLCRTDFRHFPAVCLPLHEYLALTFPEEMKSREEETAKLERDEYHAESPDVFCDIDTTTTSDQDGDGVTADALRALFKCVECQKLAVPPTVLTCGHIVCRGTASETGGDCCSLLRKKKICPINGCVGMVRNEGGDDASPAVCALIDKILRSNMSDTEYEAAASVSAKQCTGLRLEDDGTDANAASTTAATSAAAAETSEKNGHSFALDDAVVIVGLKSRSGSQFNGRLATVTSGPSRVGGRYVVTLANPPAGREPTISVKAQHLQRDGGTGNESFVHYGVGCDGCGVLPITGRRYKCNDCSELIGYDLCGDCYDNGVHTREAGDGNVAAGRFNQQHRPDHTMVEIEQKFTILHQLQAANPEVPLSQLMQMLDFEVGTSLDDNDSNAEGNADDDT